MIRWHRQVVRGRNARVDAACQIVFRPVARAEVAARPVGCRGRRVRGRHVARQASQMRADTDQNRVFRLDRAVPVLRVRRLLMHGGIRIGRGGIPGSAPARSSGPRGVRLTINIGAPRHSTTICCPTAIFEMSISMGAPAAITSADGFMESISGQAMAPAPIAAPDTAMRDRRSRRLGSGPDEAACDIIGRVRLTPIPVNRGHSGDFATVPGRR